jgi:hypothetical protein
MSATPVSGQKRKATQALSNSEPKKSRPDNMDPKEWLTKCGIADRVACTKLRKRVKASHEYKTLPSDNARTSFLESRVTSLMETRDAAGISLAIQEGMIISETRRQDAAAREAEHELLRSTLAGMVGNQSGNKMGQKDEVKSSLKLVASFFILNILFANFV